MIIATFAQALSSQAPSVNVISVLVVWRFIVCAWLSLFNDQSWLLVSQMGVGIGGDYPLSAIISSEFGATRIRGRMMTAVFANQGWGNFCEPSIVIRRIACNLDLQLHALLHSLSLPAINTTSTGISLSMAALKFSTPSGAYSLVLDVFPVLLGFTFD